MNASETFSVFEQKFMLILNLIFPGLFLLETVFQIGVFSGGISSLYDFVLLLFWAIALSMPFLVMSAHQLRLERLLGVPFQKLAGSWVSLAIRFPLALVNAVVVSFLFKAIRFLGWFDFVVPVIPPEQLVFVAALVIASAFGYPIAWVYWKILKSSILKDSIEAIKRINTEHAESESGAGS